MKILQAILDCIIGAIYYIINSYKANRFKPSIFQEDTVMRLRYFKDDYIYYKILGADNNSGKIIEFESVPKSDSIFKTLPDCTKYILQNISLQKELNDIYDEMKKDNGNNPSYAYNNFNIIVCMKQISDKRSSTPDNILHFCQSAMFKFNRRLVCKQVIFDFRKNIDPKLEYATLYSEGDNILFYSDKTVIAGDYFSNVTSDRELANFVLNNLQAIVY